MVNKVEPSSESQDKKVFYTFHLGNSRNTIDCTVGGVELKMFVDSGSDANLITADTWEKLKFRKVEVLSCQKGSRKILRAYGSQNPLDILGTFNAIITVAERAVQAEFFVVAKGHYCTRRSCGQ